MIGYEFTHIHSYLHSNVAAPTLCFTLIKVRLGSYSSLSFKNRLPTVGVADPQEPAGEDSLRALFDCKDVISLTRVMS